MMASVALDALLTDNAAAVAELASVVDRIDGRLWFAPVRAGGWTAAQHVAHVALAYHAAIGDVRDGRAALPIGNRWQRRLWWAVGLSQVVWFRRLPAGVEAPAEIRPPAESPAREATLQDLDASSAEFDRVMRDAWIQRRGHKVRHPYFGKISLRQTVVLCAVHTRHHTRLLGRLRPLGGVDSSDPLR
jgi:uncharacterized damage-inducible protein DinB